MRRREARQGRDLEDAAERDRAENLELVVAGARRRAHRSRRRGCRSRSCTARRRAGSPARCRARTCRRSSPLPSTVPVPATRPVFVSGPVDSNVLAARTVSEPAFANAPGVMSVRPPLIVNAPCAVFVARFRNAIWAAKSLDGRGRAVEDDVGRIRDDVGVRELEGGGDEVPAAGERRASPPRS